MPKERPTLRILGVAAMLVAALGLGVFLGTPETAVAQEDTTTTTVVEEPADESSDSQRPGDHDCGDRGSRGSGGDDSTESSSTDI